MSCMHFRSLPHEKIISSLLKNVKEELPEAAYIYSNKRDEPLVRSLSTLSYGGSIEMSRWDQSWKTRKKP